MNSIYKFDSFHRGGHLANMGNCTGNRKSTAASVFVTEPTLAKSTQTASIQTAPIFITDPFYREILCEELEQATERESIPIDIFSNLQDDGRGDDYEVTSIATYPFDFKLNRTKLRLQRLLHDLLHGLHLYSDWETYIAHVVATGDNRDASEVKEDCDLYVRDRIAFERQCVADRKRKRFGVRRILDLWNRLDRLASSYKETGKNMMTPEDRAAFKNYAMSINGESRCKNLLLSL